VAAVGFAFGPQLGLPEHNARDLAELLMRTRTIAGVRAAGKILEQADRDPDRGELSQGVELDPDELLVLDHLLAEESWPPEQSASNPFATQFGELVACRERRAGRTHPALRRIRCCLASG
jgi:hypothetical protein